MLSQPGGCSRCSRCRETRGNEVVGYCKQQQGNYFFRWLSASCSCVVGLCAEVRTSSAQLREQMAYWGLMWWIFLMSAAAAELMTSLPALKVDVVLTMCCLLPLHMCCGTCFLAHKPDHAMPAHHMSACNSCCSVSLQLDCCWCRLCAPVVNSCLCSEKCSISRNLCRRVAREGRQGFECHATAEC